MKILDRYLLREFLRTFLGILAVLTVILLLKEILRQLPDILSEDPPPALKYVVLYFLYVLPADIVFAVPTTVILAIMFSLGSMAKRKEILAIHASGVSYARIALPLAGALLLLTAGVYLSNETIVPGGQERAYYIEKVLMKPPEKRPGITAKSVTIKGAGNRFYALDRFDAASNTLVNPTITEVTDDGHSIRTRIGAESAYPVERSPDGEWRPVADPLPDHAYHWEFRDALRIDFDEQGNIHREHFDRVQILMEENLDRFLYTRKRVDQMNARELYAQSRIEAQRSPGGETYRDLVTSLQYRLAFPAATLLLGLIGYTLAVRSSIRSLVFEFGMALLAIALYYALLLFMEKVAGSGALRPAVALWIPNGVFLLIMLWRFHKLERVPKR